jgi:hypothetical protein
MVSRLQTCLLNSIKFTISILCIQIGFSEKGSIGFTRFSKGSMAQKMPRTPAFGVTIYMSEVHKVFFPA